MLEFFTQSFGIVSTFLLDGFTTNKSRLVITVIGCNNEVNTSVNTYNITDVRNITFFDIHKLLVCEDNIYHVCL